MMLDMDSKCHDPRMKSSLDRNYCWTYDQQDMGLKSLYCLTRQTWTAVLLRPLPPSSFASSWLDQAKPKIWSDIISVWRNWQKNPQKIIRRHKLNITIEVANETKPAGNQGIDSSGNHNFGAFYSDGGATASAKTPCQHNHQKWQHHWQQLYLPSSSGNSVPIMITATPDRF